MQPRCRQVPPTFSFSMTATLSPNWAPRIAPTYPAEPPPMTATSNASSGIQNDCRRHPGAHLALQQRQCRGQLRVLREVVWGPVNGIFVLRVGERDRLVGRDAGLVDRVALGRQPARDRQMKSTFAPRATGMVLRPCLTTSLIPSLAGSTYPAGLSRRSSTIILTEPLRLSRSAWSNSVAVRPPNSKIRT